MAKLKMHKPNTLRMAQGPSLKVADANSWRSGKTSTQRGYGYKWQKAREGFLAKHPLCVYCQRDESRVTAATVVDHRIPHRGDMALFWDSNNWMSLCAHCHNTTKKREEEAELRHNGRSPEVL